MEDSQDPADMIEEIATQLGRINTFLLHEYGEFSFERQLFDLEIRLDDIVDILRTETKRKAQDIGYGGIAYCLFCGEQFPHGGHHHCPNLVTRGILKADV